MALTMRSSSLVKASRGRLTVCAATAVPKQFKAVKPVGDRVLVKVDKEEAKSVGGVLLPASVRNKPTAGSVIALGDAKSVKLSDKVIYSKFAGTELDLGGAEHVLLKEEDVIGVLPATEKVAQMKPLSDRILIKGAKAEDKSSGGVLLATESAEKPTFGTVVAVGEGREDEETKAMIKPNVEVGATVMYSKYSGTEFEEDGENFIVVRESDILAQLA
ncbi:hypothetical protein HYH02_013524 [Chlamydomonas schloesseri]|uniref:20 kDa chaperonin, chloroplastic n=1 Tax=Chlamydomonas schloesseri TaxID=2026947 RepID=A0A835VVL5_9CHLO|nr:hypothetical protein HYH02_013524 [Chlamydomonas schloesseri]|eukprot:KAG2430992.1 hypothetical protein HYH02_013524 [Chlamydomonas schloesseri]